MIESNPHHKISHNKVVEVQKRYVTDDEMDLVQIAGEVGKQRRLRCQSSYP